MHALSDYNCEVYAKDKNDYTALLHLSCERGYVGLVRTLVTERKADVNARTDSGNTPLIIAVCLRMLRCAIAFHVYKYND